MELSNTRKTILANYIGQAWVSLMGIAFLPIFIKYLGMESYGLIGVFALVQSWLALLDMGMAPTLNREMARYKAGAYDADSIKDLLRSLEIIFLIVASLVVVVIFSCSAMLASNWLKVEKLPLDVVTQAISIIAFIVALRFIEGMYRSSLFGLNKQVWFNGVSAILATVRQLGALAVLAWYSPTIQAFFIWQGIISLVTVIVLAMGVYFAIPHTTRRPKFSKDLLLSVWKFAGGMLSITILSILLTQVDKLLLSKLLSLESFGFYTLSATVASVLYMVVGPLTQALYPKMVELVAIKDQQKLAEIYHKGCQLVTVLVAPVALVIGTYAEGVMFAWSGDPAISYHTSSILSIMILGTFLNSLMYVPYHLQLAYGWTSLAVKINLISVCILVPAILLVVPKYGALGSAYIWLILNLGYFCIGIYFMHRKVLKMELWKWYFSDVICPVTGIVMVILISRLLMPANYSSRVDWLIFLCSTVVVACITATVFASDIKQYISLKALRVTFSRIAWKKI